MKLTSDLIYEAALDDELFAQLPTIVAQSLAARSCVLHWRDRSGMAEISAHSGYFSDGQMEEYAANFVEHDLWTAAGMRQGFINQAWNTTDIVPTSEYERSVFFNEWIRTMGDDTFYCCGSVMRTEYGDGIIGLHRGKSQSDFSDRSLRQLNGHVDHLRRMFAIRGRISDLQKRSDLLDQIFNAGSRAAFVLNSECRIMMVNDQGESVLRLGRFLRIRNGQVQPRIEADRTVFELAIAAAFEPPNRRGSDCILRSNDEGAALVSFMPLSSQLSRAAVLMTVEEPRRRLPRDVVLRHLQTAYGLSAAEADVALRIGDGQTVQEIGEARRSTAGTVRVQVKQILSKLGARRQADVARMVTTCLLIDNRE
ncbi:MAG TPA: LuxR C-terminal-related transcriptional regulator [Sphingomicrobium sp.]|nr:LuxR C-terminal-related transcriptional regulator [Sphingomicrobium sp.]